MRLRSLFALWVLAVLSLSAAPKDIVISQQQNATPPSWTPVIVLPAANSLLGFGPTKTVGNVTVGTGLTLSSGVLSAAGITNTLTTTAPLAGGGALSSNLTLSIPAATGSVNGYLSSADWTTFNGKQAAGNYITALTGDATASGPGSAAVTLATVNANTGTLGSATQSLTVTLNAKGLVTAASAQTVTPAFSSVTGKPTTSVGYGITNGAAIDALGAVASNGIIVRTGANTYTARTLTGTAGNITVTNGDGVSGNMTVSLPTALTSIDTVTAEAATNLVLNGGSTGASLTLGQGSSGAVTLTSKNSLALNPAATQSIISTIGDGMPGHIFTSTGTASGVYSQWKLSNGSIIGDMGVSGTSAFFGSETNNPVVIRQNNTAAVTIATTTQAVSIASTTASTSSTTGSLIVGGGAGIAGAAYVGTILNLPGSDFTTTYGIKFATDLQLYRFTATSFSGLSLDYAGTNGPTWRLNNTNAREVATLTYAKGGTIQWYLGSDILDSNTTIWGLYRAGAGYAISFDSSRNATFSAAVTSTSATGGIGYATGAGGAVTQGAGRTTGVTVSKVSGAITTDTASLAALAAATFTVTNTAVAIGDVVVVSKRSGATNVKTIVSVSATAAGSFNITVYNADASTAETGAIIINFAVIKAVSS